MNNGALIIDSAFKLLLRSLVELDEVIGSELMREILKKIKLKINKQKCNAIQ